jgi:hypothetical protein
MRRGVAVVNTATGLHCQRPAVISEVGGAINFLDQSALAVAAK